MALQNSDLLLIRTENRGTLTDYEKELCTADDLNMVRQNPCLSNALSSNGYQIIKK